MREFFISALKLSAILAELLGLKKKLNLSYRVVITRDTWNCICNIIIEAFTNTDFNGQIAFLGFGVMRKGKIQRINIRTSISNKTVSLSQRAKACVNADDLFSALNKYDENDMVFLIAETTGGMQVNKHCGTCKHLRHKITTEHSNKN